MREIVERAMNGDRESFGVLVGRTSDRLYAIATRILRDPFLAEDALQGAMITCWQQLPKLRDPDRFEAWATKLVVHSLCYAESRKRTARTANVRSLVLDAPAAGDQFLSVADRDALDRAFRHLSIEQRAVFVLHHHVGLSLVETAETLGIPAGTARSRLHYAIQVLRSSITSDDELLAAEGRTA